MITAEQVADLQPGDVVELTLDGVSRGAFSLLARVAGHQHGELSLAGERVIRFGDGRVPTWASDDYSLKVIGRALYVNHPRTEPVPGDVVRADSCKGSVTWTCHGPGNWTVTATHEAHWGDLPDRLRLLVDGETGQVVQ